MFFSSVFTPSFVEPRRRRLTLPSQRMEPSSMEQSEMPMAR